MPFHPDHYPLCIELNHAVDSMTFGLRKGRTDPPRRAGGIEQTQAMLGADQHSSLDEARVREPPRIDVARQSQTTDIVLNQQNLSRGCHEIAVSIELQQRQGIVIYPGGLLCANSLLCTGHKAEDPRAAGQQRTIRIRQQRDKGSFRTVFDAEHRPRRRPSNVIDGAVGRNQHATQA